MRLRDSDRAREEIGGLGISREDFHALIGRVAPWLELDGVWISAGLMMAVASMVLVSGVVFALVKATIPLVEQVM